MCLWGGFLTLVTLWFVRTTVLANRVYGALVNNTRFGDARFSYDGRDSGGVQGRDQGPALSVR